MCEAGCTRWGMPDSLVPGTVSFDPKQMIFGNRLVGVSSVGAPLRVFRSTMQGYKPIDCRLLTVNSCIKVHLDLQADKSPVVVKGPFFPRVVNPRYRIRGTMCNTRIQSSKAR
jgi:hypothetical protein